MELRRGDRYSPDKDILKISLPGSKMNEQLATGASFTFPECQDHVCTFFFFTPGVSVGLYVCLFVLQQEQYLLDTLCHESPTITGT